MTKRKKSRLEVEESEKKNKSTTGFNACINKQLLLKEKREEAHNHDFFTQITTTAVVYYCVMFTRAVCW